MPSLRDFVCAFLSAVLGAWAFYKTQSETKELFEPIMAACSGKEESSAKVVLVPYEPLLGGPFVCMITQFIHFLVENSPAGFVVWGATICTIVTAGVLMGVESGRSGSSGPVRYPTVINLLAIVLGISVIFPLVWVPSYLLLGGSRTGAVLPSRPYAALYLSLPGLLLTILCFTLNPSTYLWTLVAGLLGSPLLGFLSLGLWGMEKPGQDVAHGAIATSKAYIMASLLTLCLWIAVAKTAWDAYIDFPALWDGLWVSAHPAVRFMTIDAGIFYAGLVLYIASMDPIDAVACLFLTPLLGPGAAPGLVLWGHERVRAAAASAKKDN